MIDILNNRHTRTDYLFQLALPRYFLAAACRAEKIWLFVDAPRAFGICSPQRFFAGRRVQPPVDVGHRIAVVSVRPSVCAEIVRLFGVEGAEKEDLLRDERRRAGGIPRVVLVGDKERDISQNGVPDRDPVSDTHAPDGRAADGVGGGDVAERTNAASTVVRIEVAQTTIRVYIANE